MKRVKRTKKQDERIVNDPFKELPDELNVEVLMKLPPRSIASLRFSSKHLSSIILGKKFTELYMTRSLTQPRHLVTVHGGDHYVTMHRFHSISQENPSSDHDKVSYKLDPYGPYRPYKFAPPVRGLICGRNRTKMVVGNPSTGQFVFLPRVKTTKKNIFSVFGYDPVNDVYKVLCMTVVAKRSNISRGVAPCDAMSEEHQVITLGGGKQKWRMIECKYPHRHYSGCQGICRDGVMYYLASYKEKRSLMSFDLSSEDFNVIKLPEDEDEDVDEDEDATLQQFGELVNHAGKITIATLQCMGPVELWVLEDVNKEIWSKSVVVMPSVADMFGMSYTFEFRGILGTGEMILTPITTPNPFYFLCYNPEGEKFRKIVIDERVRISDTIQVFFDHVESYMVL